VKRQKDLFLMVEKLGKDRRSLFLVGGQRGKGAIKLIIQKLYDEITPSKRYDIIKLTKKTLH
jgi:hypothetical protein